MVMKNNNWIVYHVVPIKIDYFSAGISIQNDEEPNESQSIMRMQTYRTANHCKLLDCDSTWHP